MNAALPELLAVKHKRKKIFSGLTCFLLSLIAITPINPSPSSARASRNNWNDLDENARERIYGSEKEKKFPVSNPLLQVESWENHFSVNVLYLYRYTNYPAFRSHRFLPEFAPFIYSLKSKKDNRSKSWIFPLWYSKTDGDYNINITLPGYIKRDKGELDTSFLYLFYAGYHERSISGDNSEKTSLRPSGSGFSKGSYHGLLPVYFVKKQIWKRDSKHESKKFSYITPLFFGSTSEDTSNDRTVRKSEFISPILIKTGEETCSGECTPIHSSTFFPAIPFLYYSEKKGDTYRHINFLTLFDTLYRNNRIERLLFFPLVYYGSTQEDRVTFNFFPLVFYKNYPDTKRLTLLPLFHYSSRSYPYKDNDKKLTTFISPFVYRQHSTQSDNSHSSSLWMVPILPFLYYSNQAETPETKSLHRNFLTIFDYKKYGGEYKHFWIIPLVFNGHGPTSTDNSDGISYFHVIPPLFMNFTNEGHTFYSSLLPVYVWFWTDRKNGGLYTLPFQYHRSGDTHNIAFLYPLLHYQWSDRGIEKLWLPGVYFKRGHYFHFFPVYFSFSSEEARTTILPGYYSRETQTEQSRLFGLVWNSKTETDEEKKTSLHILPLYFSWDSRNKLTPDGSVAESSKSVSLLHFFQKEKTIGNGEESTYHDTFKFWFPLLPIFYYRNDSEKGSSSRFLYFFNVQNDTAGLLKQVWFPPVFFKRNSYFHAFPLFFRPNAMDAESGVSFGPIHYHSWSPEKETRWILLHYNTHNTANDHYTDLYLPLYFAWKNAENRGKVILPFYFEYEDHTKYMELTLALWNSKEAGTIAPDASVGRFKKKWYLDADLSFLYNLFSIETRVSVDIPKIYDSKSNVDPDIASISEAIKLDNRTDQEKGAFLPPAPGKAEIHKKKGVARDESEYYFGWSALYGMISYAESDTKRHFRMLPLGWFTWDTASDDKVTLLPPFLPLYFNYVSDELEYKVILPLLYGKQRKAKSFIESYFLIGLIREYDDTEQREEYSVLWPLFNYYRSPKRSGSRFLPFYILSSEETENTRNSYLFTPVYYETQELVYESESRPENRKREEKNSRQLISKSGFSISPFHMHNFREESGYKKETTFAPVIPLYYESTNYRYKNDKNLINKTEEIENEKYYRRDHTSYLFPFYYSESSYGDNDRLISSLFFAPILPLFYWKKAEGNSIFESYFLILFHREYDNTTNKRELSFLWPLINYHHSPSDSGSSFFPFYLHRRSETKERKSSYFLSPVYYETEETVFKSSREDEKGASEKEKIERSTFSISPFHIHKSKDVVSAKSDTFLFPIIPLYYHSTRSVRINIPADNKKSDISEATDDTYYLTDRTSFLFPLYYSSKRVDTEGNTLSNTFFFPIIPLFASWQNSEGSNLFIAGLHLFNSPSGASRTNFLYLFENEKSPAEKYRSVDLLFRTMHYRTDNLKTEHSFLYGLGYDYTGWKESDEYNLRVLGFIYGQSRKENKFHWHLFPLVFYNSTPDSYSSFILGTYWKNTPYESRQNILYLFDHEKDKRNDSWRTGLLFNTIDFERTNSFSSFHLLYGLGMSYKKFNHSFQEGDSPEYKYSMLMGLFSQNYQKETLRSYLFPVYYYRNEKNRRNKFIMPYIPVLAYHESETGKFAKNGVKNSSTNWILSGLLWYSDKEIYSNSLNSQKNTTMGHNNRLFLLGLYFDYDNYEEKSRKAGLLGGILYYYSQKPARGYESRGSLWGLLWDYEKESETNYYKFSILKFLFSKTRTSDGEEYTRILGIKVHSSKW